MAQSQDIAGHAGLQAVVGAMPEGSLAAFQELLAVDSAVLLHDLLKGAFAGTRTAKLHVVMNLLDSSPNLVDLTGASTSETSLREQSLWPRMRPKRLFFEAFSWHKLPMPEEALSAHFQRWAQR